MANNCDSQVRISGEPEKLQRLVEKIGKEKNGDNSYFSTFNYENYETIFESIDDVEDWGSKWQVMNIEYYSDDTTLFIMGESAWQPADGLWKKISKEFNVEVVLEYSEPGMNFAGITSWCDGEEIERQEMTYYEYLYENDSEYFWEEVGYRCECLTLDEIISDLGEVYENMDSSEKERINQIHSNNYIE